MTTRLLLLLLVLAAGFCSIFALPKSYATRLSALPGNLVSADRKFDLPNLVGYWSGGPGRKPSDKELKILAEDTVFHKRNYLRANSSLAPRAVNSDATDLERLAAMTPYEDVEVSIVTSNSDMGNSIHRPERCLTAQGFNVEREKKFIVKVRGKDLPVKKLTTVQHVKDEATGNVQHLRNVTYYWFVGYDTLTNDHYTRTWQDMKDRLVRGFDQQWAYATVGMMLAPHAAINEALAKDPDTKGQAVLTRAIDDDAVDAEGLTEADRIMQEFISDLSKEIIDRKMIADWNTPGPGQKK